MKSVAILWGKLDRHSWQQTTVPDLLHMAEVVALGTLVLFGIGLGVHAGDTGFPRTVPIIEGIVAVLLMGSGRLIRPRGRRPPDAAGPHPEGGSRAGSSWSAPAARAPSSCVTSASTPASGSSRSASWTTSP